MSCKKRIKRTKWWVLLLCHLLCIPVSALDPNQPIDRYLMDEWEVSAGLPSDTVNALAQTGNGYLWIGTNKGLVRFDGFKFEMMAVDQEPGSQTKRISALFVDKKGDLWIGHAAGLTRFQEGEFRTFSEMDGLPGERISELKGDVNDNLWIGTADNYLSRLAEGRFTLFDTSKGLTGKFITALLEDWRGFLWAATLIDGLFRFQYGKFTRIEIPGLGPKHSLHALHEDRDNYLWIGTNMGLCRVKDQDVQIYTTRDGLSDNRVNEILEDSSGNLWVGTVNGLNRIKKSFSANPRIESCLKNHYINCLLEDREKSLWIGTNGSSLKRLREGVFSTYSTENGLANFISSIYQERDGTLWIGTDYGKLYHGSQGKFKEFSFKADILDLRIRTIGADAQGHVLVGTSRSGIFQVTARELNRYYRWPDLDDTIIQVIYPDSRANLWIGTMGKGLILIRQGIRHYYTISDGLTSNVILDIHEDLEHNILLATSSGINVLAGGQFNQNRRYLKGVFTLAIHEDNSGISWIGTLGKGLAWCKGGRFQFITAKNGLGSDNIHQILEDERQQFWMSSDVGILKVSKEDLSRFAAGEIDKVHCTVYGLSDGMKSVDCPSWGKNSAVKTRANQLWFATRKGISLVNPGKLKIDKLPAPAVIIEKVITSGKNGENIDIHFSAPTFIALERVQFKYRLDGWDKENDWHFIKKGEKRAVKYAHLTPGDYTFRVTACNSDGVWNEPGASLDLRITPVPAKSPLYFMTLFLVILLVGTGAYVLGRKLLAERRRSRKYQNSPLDPAKAEACLKKLVYLLEYEQVYRDETISLTSLADRLAVPYHQLSQIINEKLHKNFYDLINTYRIEEAKKRLIDVGQEKRSVLAIAYDVGFNTKAAFNRVFKKYTSMTPSQFRKKFQG